MRTVLRSLVHNVVAHPLLFWGDLGDWLHDITAPGDDFEGYHVPAPGDPGYNPNEPI